MARLYPCAGGGSDSSARHQPVVLKKRRPGIETIVRYKPGAGGGLMWAQINSMPADGYYIIGVNLPHIVLQPFEDQVQYETDDVMPVYWQRDIGMPMSASPEARKRMGLTKQA